MDPFDNPMLPDTEATDDAREDAPPSLVLSAVWKSSTLGIAFMEGTSLRFAQKTNGCSLGPPKPCAALAHTVVKGDVEGEATKLTLFRMATSRLYGLNGKKKSQPVNKDRFISKMFLRGDSVILVLRNPN